MATSKCNYISLQYLIFVGIILLFISPKCTDALERRIDPEIQRRMEDFIENDYLPETRVPGLGLSIIQNDGELLYTTGYGLADIAKGIRIENSTQFLIASVTKSMTALLVAKLLHQNFPELGEAALDTPIRMLLPQANFTLIDRFRSEHATLRDLLAHRMCLDNVDVDLLADPFESTAEALYRVRYLTEICGMRSRWEYSNRMYMVAGEMAALMAGKSFIDAMQDLFDQIGMPNSKFVHEDDDFDQMPFRTKPYYIRDNVTYPYNVELLKRGKSAASGELFSTPDDMLTYVRLHLNKGVLDGKQVISRDVMEWMVKPSILAAEFDYKQSDRDLVWNEFGYSLGLQQMSYDGWECIQHGGYTSPYSSLLSWFPAKNLGIFTSSNMGPEELSQRVLHTFIFELLRGSEDPKGKAMKIGRDMMRNASKDGKKATETGKKFKDFYRKIVEKANSKGVMMKQNQFVGKYGNGGLGDAEVIEKFYDQTNQTEYYFEYGVWYKGWLLATPDGAGLIFNLVLDTDVIHEDYALGNNGDDKYVAFDNDGTSLTLFGLVEGEEFKFATFQLGVNLDKLPTIPWAPNSCGPEPA